MRQKPKIRIYFRGKGLMCIILEHGIKPLPKKYTFTNIINTYGKDKRLIGKWLIFKNHHALHPKK